MKRHFLRLTVEHDQDLECPNEMDGWRLYSFCRRHSSFREPEQIGLDSHEPKATNKELKNKLKRGFAFWLSYYEHGNCLWMLRDIGATPAGVEFQWDGTRSAGILIWEQPLENLGQKNWAYKRRAEDAAAFLETYTNWANGNGVYYRLETDKGKDVDSCGGFYSLDDAMQTIQTEALHGDTYKGWPIVVTGDLAHAVTSYHTIEGHEYVKSEDDVGEIEETADLYVI